MRIMNYPVAVLALAIYACSPTATRADPNSEKGPPTVNFGAALSDHDLGAQRGGQDQFINDMKLYAQLNNNKALSNVTGYNLVTQNAFAGTKGFATVIQNSGNNVIIQNATILNLTMQ